MQAPRCLCDKLQQSQQILLVTGSQSQCVLLTVPARVFDPWFAEYCDLRPASSVYRGKHSQASRLRAFSIVPQLSFAFSGPQNAYIAVDIPAPLICVCGLTLRHKARRHLSHYQLPPHNLPSGMAQEFSNTGSTAGSLGIVRSHCSFIVNAAEGKAIVSLM